MKKVLALAVACAFTLSSFVTAAAPGKAAKQASIDGKVKQAAIVEKFKANSGKDFQIDWNTEKGNPGFVKGNLSDKVVKGSDDAVQYLKDNKDLFQLNGGDFKVKTAKNDTIGMTHYKAVYTVDGIPVYGDEVIVHTDKNGNVKVINGSIDSDVPVKAWKNEVKLSAEQAIKLAEATLDFAPDYKTVPAAEMYLYEAKGEWQPVYVVTLHFWEPTPTKQKVFVSAVNGDIVGSYNDMKFDTSVTGSGTDVFGVTRQVGLTLKADGKYYMEDNHDGDRIMTYDDKHAWSWPGELAFSTTNTFTTANDKAIVSAQYNTDKVYHFYLNNFTRRLGTVVSSVHYGMNYDNAFSDGAYQVYGDGNGLEYREFCAGADVIAHEMTHTVIAGEGDLEYVNQSGAYNESLADIFGYLAEGDANDWRMAEDITTNGLGFRSIAHPEEFGDPAHMSDFLVTTADEGGVHTNNGILNKAFYNAATQINDNAKMAQIYYRVICNYITYQSNFEDAMNQAVQAARDLYGDSVAQTIANAYHAVGIADPSIDSFEPNDTRAQATPIESGTAYESYIYKSNDVDYYQFTTSGAGPISVSMTNLPCDYDLYLQDSTGAQKAFSSNYETANENMTYNCPGAGTYYVKVVNNKNQFSLTQKYKLTATYPNGVATQWTTEAVSIDSPHDYTNNYNGTNTYTKAGATKVSVHFTTINTESGYDFVKVLDKNGNQVGKYSGSLTDFWVDVDGDTININLTSDSSVTGYGYHIDQVRYTMQ